jgi:sRNA-binding carbon storage regulator CsrA
MALVIRRHPGETLVLTTPEGHRIVVEARYDDDRGAIRVSIDAPREVVVTRGELEGR